MLWLFSSAAALAGLGLGCLISAPSASPVAANRERDTIRIEALLGELELAKMELTRFKRVVAYSERYEIPADLAALVWDVAIAEDVDPRLAFALLHVESRFDPLAVSTAGAIGLAQVMPETAALLQPGIAYSDLLSPERNVRLGLRYLRLLLHESGADTVAALLKYNGCVRNPGCRSYPQKVLASASGGRALHE